MARREQDRTYTVKKRALEVKVKLARHEQDQTYTAKKRALGVSTDVAIASSQSKAKMAPYFVCTICHRMMCKQNVACNKSKYTKASDELL